MSSVNPVTTQISTQMAMEPTPKVPQRKSMKDDSEFRKVFHQFVGETLYGQMLKSMRNTQQKPAYFDGGHAEEIFQMQLDQTLVTKMAEAGSTKITDPMFKLLTAPRQ